MIVPDSRNDIRFFDNPLVTGSPNVIFYTGVPLNHKNGFPLGTLCVMDNKPNSLDEFQLKALKALSNQIISLFELRKKSYELEIKAYEAEAQNIILEKFAGTATHDIKSPLATIVMLADLLDYQYSKQLDDEGLELIKMINTSANSLTQFIDEILKYSQNTRLLLEDKENVIVKEIIVGIIQLIDPNKEAKFTILPQNNFTVYTNKGAPKQIILILLINCLKYNDKRDIKISITIEDLKTHVKFNVIDNGPGIKAEDLDRVFQIFETTSNSSKSGVNGTGIGLATVKSLVEGLGGTIHLTLEIGKGANFEFTLRK